MASGMEAAEVLPWRAMSRATTTDGGQLEGAEHGVGDPHVGLVRDEDLRGPRAVRRRASSASAAVLAMV